LLPTATACLLTLDITDARFVLFSFF